MNTQGKSKILVDGNCIVCDMEITHYKRRCPDLFDVVDISNPDFKASDYNLSTEDVNKHLHVITPDGKILRGVDSFAHSWSRIPQYAIASKAIKLPGIHLAAKLGYAVFVEIRPWLPKKRALG